MCLGILLLTLSDDPFILSGFILIVNSLDLTFNTMCVRVLNPLTILFIWDFIMVFRDCSVVRDATSTFVHYLTCDIFPRLQSRSWLVSCLWPHTGIMRWCKHKTTKHIGAAWLLYGRACMRSDLSLRMIRTGTLSSAYCDGANTKQLNIYGIWRTWCMYNKSSRGLELRILRWCDPKTAKHFGAAWTCTDGPVRGRT